MNSTRRKNEENHSDKSSGNAFILPLPYTETILFNSEGKLAKHQLFLPEKDK